ncbi:MAG: hypothetical protein JNL82_14545 [Myxococcales bacterium]|nr:hypothetical protein [Myxococcales bacterium]
MQRSTRALLAVVFLATACRNGGACRPAPPDPEPADTVPVGGDDPNKPIEQPSTPPAPAKPATAPPT